MLAAASVGLDEVSVGIGVLRILVQVLHVRVRGRGIEIEVVLFHVLAMIALAVVARPKARSFRIGSRPFHSASAKHSTWWSSLIPPRPSSPPPVGARAGLVMGEVVPGVAVVAVVLAHRSPLPLSWGRGPTLSRPRGWPALRRGGSSQLHCSCARSPSGLQSRASGSAMQSTSSRGLGVAMMRPGNGVRTHLKELRRRNHLCKSLWLAPCREIKGPTDCRAPPKKCG